MSKTTFDNLERAISFIEFFNSDPEPRLELFIKAEEATETIKTYIRYLKDFEYLQINESTRRHLDKELVKKREYLKNV